MKKTAFLISTLCIALILFLTLQVSRQQESLRTVQTRLDEQREAFETLQAEKTGLMEANRLLQNKIAEFREAPPFSEEAFSLRPALTASDSEPEEPEPVYPVAEDPHGDMEAYNPAPPTEPPSISPQLRQMMEQFPEHASEEFATQPNTIQMYLDANPEIAEELQQPQGRFGSGIEQVMRENPDLAEKVKKNMSLSNP